MFHFSEVPLPMSIRPQIDVAVLMRREAVQGPMARWQPWRWVLADVVPNEASFGTEPRCLRQTGAQSLWLHPACQVTLFTDDAEGYWLNATSPTPCYFVMWRLVDAEDGSEPAAVPQAVSLSYHDAGRWLDAQETVETVPAAASVLSWMQGFAAQHFVPEEKRRQRPQSFQRLTDRFGQPVSVSTDAKRKGARTGA
jgi:Protein of unknown function (DUF3305)